jgi:hypothetical protein
METQMTICRIAANSLYHLVTLIALARGTVAAVFGNFACQKAKLSSPAVTATNAIDHAKATAITVWEDPVC